MHKFSCKFLYNGLNITPARLVWAEVLIDPTETTELARTPEATSMYATPAAAETFVRENAQQTVEILARQLAVRDTLLTEQEANAEFAYQIQLYVGYLEASALAALESTDPANAVDRLAILNRTATDLAALVDDTTGVVTTKGSDGWIERGVGAALGVGAGVGIGTGSVAVGINWLAGVVGVTTVGLTPAGWAALGVGATIGVAASGASSWYRKGQVTIDSARLGLTFPPHLQTLQSLFDDPNMSWDTTEYEIAKGGAWQKYGFETSQVSINPDKEHSKAKIDLWKTVLEVSANKWVDYEMSSSPHSNRIKAVIDQWIANNKDDITEEDVAHVREQLLQTKQEIVRDYETQVTDTANRLVGITKGIAEFTTVFPDFNPGLLPAETALLTKPVATIDLSDIAPAQALELKVRTAAFDYLKTKLDPTTTGLPPGSNAFVRAEALRVKITSLPNLTDPDVGYKLIRWAEQTKDVFDDYEQEKQITELTGKVATLQVELDRLLPENETLKREKEELKKEVERLKGEITTQKTTIVALTAEIEELQKKIKVLEGKTTPPSNPADPTKPPKETLPPPVIRERIDVRKEQLHHIASMFFSDMGEIFAEKKKVEQRQLMRKIESVSAQDFTALEKFVGNPYERYEAKELKQRFKDSGLDKRGLFLEKNEAIHTFQFGVVVVRAVHELKDLGVSMDKVLPQDDGNGWDDIRGTTDSVVDQLRVYLSPYFPHKGNE